MKYISQPPLLLNVHMHNPTVSVRSWMDSLLAFFPGLQVCNPVLKFAGLITFTAIKKIEEIASKGVSKNVSN